MDFHTLQTLLQFAAEDPARKEAVKTIIAYAILAVPLFSLPFIMKAAGGMLERFGLWANNRQKGLIDRSRNWAGQESKRQRANNMAKLASSEWGKDQSGKMGSFKRGLSSTARGVGGYGSRRAAKHQFQQRNAEQAQEEEINKLLSEVDAQGKPTERAQRYAMAAAGAGGASGAERIRQVANERMLKEYNEEVDRRNKTLALNDFFLHETKDVTATDKNGKTHTSLPMHQRLAAVSSGAKVSWTDQKGVRHEVDGKDRYWQEAAMAQIDKTSDNKAISATLTGEPKPGEPDFRLTDAQDVATLKKYIVPNSGFRGTFPQMAKTDSGAWTNPTAGQMTNYFVDTARLAVDFAMKSPNPEVMKTLRQEFEKAMLNEDNYATMAVDTRKMFEKRLGMDASAIRKAAGKAVGAES